MQDVTSLLILEAACNLSKNRQEVMREIARIAASAVPHGPIAAACFDLDSQLDAGAVHFERADPGYVLRFLDWQRSMSGACRALMLGLAPGIVDVPASTCGDLPADYLAEARGLTSLCVMANTGNGRGLHIMFGNPDLRDWPSARVQALHDVAHHLAAIWRIRQALDAGEHAAAAGFSATPRGALVQAVLARERTQRARRSASAAALWPALIAGRWSLLDAFTAGGDRYLVAYRNPEAAVALRTLAARERSVLELALAGESGKWIASELAVSESVVARSLRTALRKLGVADTAALAGVQSAVFEPLDGLNAGVDLALARLAPAVRSLANLSGAERAIAIDLLGGKRASAIARARGTSPRTVAHQIASVYKKLGASSRRELLALLG